MLLLATSNKGKLVELQGLLKNIELKIVGIDDVSSLPKGFDIEETGITFKQNAILKAKGFGKKSGLVTVADDTGLVIDALSGQPGIHSARFAKGDFTKAKSKLLEKLKAVKGNKRSAKFVCSLALYNPQTHTTKTFSGVCHGLIALKSQGSKGFGYDSIFIPNGSNKTFGQMDNFHKNKFSHRSLAFKKLKTYLIKNLVYNHPYG